MVPRLINGMDSLGVIDVKSETVTVAAVVDALHCNAPSWKFLVYVVVIR